MEGVRTLEEKTDALQEVIHDQRELLREYVDDDVSKIIESTAEIVARQFS